MLMELYPLVVETIMGDSRKYNQKYDEILNGKGLRNQVAHEKNKLSSFLFLTVVSGLIKG